MGREEFNRHIAQALADLFDFIQLEQNPLCGILPRAEGRSQASPGRALQQAVLSGIEALKPAEGVPLSALQWRTYHLLRLRYVDGMMVKEIMNHLQLGERQLRRENQRAVAAVSSLLWDAWFSAKPAEEPPAPVVAGAHQQFEARPALVDLADAFSSILNTLQRILGGNVQRVHLRLPEPLPLVQTDRVLLRQAMIACFHHYLARRPEASVTVEGRLGESSLTLVISGSDGALTWEESERRKLQDLFSQINNHLVFEDGQVTLEIPVAAKRKILVIDDDETAIHLYRRYLTGLSFTIDSVQDGREAIAYAEQSAPNLILLDVLLPNVDGWEILQQLKASPVVGNVPVIVCSGWNEPEIARSLGAESFLRKNVLQKDLIETIQKLL